MHLCFGVLASLLLTCRKTLKNRRGLITQSQMVARLAWCVDPKSSYFSSSHASVGDLDCDQSVATKLVNCKKDFLVSFDLSPDERAAAFSEVKTKIEKSINSILTEELKPLILLTLLDIIRKDEYIEREKKETFQNYFGFYKEDLLHKAEFHFSDVLSRALQYTTHGNVHNKEPLPLPFSSQEALRHHLNELEATYRGDYQWNLTGQTLTLDLTKQFELFDKALDDHGILYFLQYADPTAALDVEAFEKARRFMYAFSPDDFKGNGITTCRIHRFQSILCKYITILQKGTRFRYNELTTNKFNQYVPLSRGEPIFGENVEDAIAFSNLVVFYRKHLVRAYSRMYAHMFFAVDKDAIEFDKSQKIKAAYTGKH